jgi:hypothetical protein
MCRFLLQILCDFYYKFILIEKFIKHDQVNYPCCDVRYFDLYFLLGFLNFIFVCYWWFFYYFTQWLLGCLIRCVHKFFDLHIGVFLLYIYAESGGENYLANVWSKKLKALGALRLLSIWEKIYLLRQVFEVCTILILYIKSRHIDEYIKYFCKCLTKLSRYLQ